MILTCTACATRYLVDATSVGSAGREVRCTRCGHTWFQSPPPDLPRDIDDEDLIISDPLAYRPAPPLPALRRPGPPWGLIAGWLILIGLISSLGFGFYHYRERVVALWPASAQLYSALHLPVPGPVLRNVRLERTHAGDVMLLVVTGSLVNASTQPARTPAVRLVLRDNVEREVARDDVHPDKRELSPGGEVPFIGRLTNPPPEARNLEVTLVATE